jgi:hypothetical protein
MFETIIVAMCLAGSCQEVHFHIQPPEEKASLQMPFHCNRQGQIQAAKWLQDHHPGEEGWTVGLIRCPRMGQNA